MKCKPLREYPLSKTVVDYYEYYNAHPHEICKGNGTKAIYGLFHDGENPYFVYSYKYAKELIRKAAKQINNNTKLL